MAAGGAPRRSQEQRRGASEDALLDAASQVIAEWGTDRASLASIGRRAGASRGLASHHFGSKEALLAQVAERAQRRSTAAVRAAVAGVDGEGEDLSALELLRTVVDTYLARLEEPSPESRALIVMWGATFPSETGVETMASADQRAYAGIEAEIRRGQEDGSIRTDVDPAGMATVLLGLMRGVGALLLTKPQGADVSSVRASCDTWMTSALAARPVETAAVGGASLRSAHRRGER